MEYLDFFQPFYVVIVSSQIYKKKKDYKRKIDQIVAAMKNANL